jgi:hypothetical protein
MRRLFWVGLGAVAAVVATERLRTVARRYTPAGVSDQVGAAGRATGSALSAAVDRFRTSMDQREKDLVATLLVEPEGGDARAVFGRRGADEPDDARAVRHGRREPDEPDEPDDARSARSGRHAGAGDRARPSGRVDDDEPLYDF